MRAIVIATRGSKLALWQAEHVRALLLSREPDLPLELLVLKTTGDRVQDRPLQEIGGKGLFTKEIEEALLDGRAQLAVHSMKDLPAHFPAGLCIGAVPRREDPRDALLLRPDLRAAAAPGSADALSRLPQGALVGTTSLRRVCLLKQWRPDLRTEPLRGNVDTRLLRLSRGDFDAIILAAAGLCRLGLSAHIDEYLDVARFVPAVGQGALALQCKEDDEETRARLLPLMDEGARLATTAERAFLTRLEGDCKTPLGAHGTIGGAVLTLDGFVAAAADGTLRRAQRSGPLGDAEAIGEKLAEQLL